MSKTQSLKTASSQENRFHNIAAVAAKSGWERQLSQTDEAFAPLATASENHDVNLIQNVRTKPLACIPKARPDCTI